MDGFCRSGSSGERCVTSENERILSRYIGALVEASMRPRERPGTVLVRHAEHILELVRISSRQSASGGMKRRVETCPCRKFNLAGN
jgi:hypothetical protein